MNCRNCGGRLLRPIATSPAWKHLVDGKELCSNGQTNAEPAGAPISPWCVDGEHQKCYERICKCPCHTPEPSLTKALADISHLSIPEPAPVANDSRAIWELVVEDMQERDRIGEERYGTRLQANNGRDALVDAYQEGLDLVVYLRQEIEERFLIINQIISWFRDVGIQMPERAKSGKGFQLAAIISDIQLAIRDLASIKQERDILLRERQGEVWFWSTGRPEDGDNPETITCPIIIQPKDLIKMYRLWIEPAKPSGLSPEFINALREMGQAHHDLHSNVSSNPVERTKEWSTCRYSYCKKRYELAHSAVTTFRSEDLLIPIPMVLHCPRCGAQHIDEPDQPDKYCVSLENGECISEYTPGGVRCMHQENPTPLWTNPPHKTHLCHVCKTKWRPAEVYTNGVEFIERGESDTWP